MKSGDKFWNEFSRPALILGWVAAISLIGGIVLYYSPGSLSDDVRILPLVIAGLSAVIALALGLHRPLGAVLFSGLVLAVFVAISSLAWRGDWPESRIVGFALFGGLMLHVNVKQWQSLTAERRSKAISSDPTATARDP